MVNWTDHGTVLKYTVLAGESKRLGCPMHRTQRPFYMYVPLTGQDKIQGAIGVAVADSPYGPFIDPLGKPLVKSGKGDIDPTVFIDDDGQAYLYWEIKLLLRQTE